MAMKRKIVVVEDDTSIPIQHALDEFIAEKEALNKSASTINNYKQSVRLFMEYFEFNHETPISEVKQKHFFEWANGLKLDYVKVTSINHYLRDCRAFFYWCMDEARGYIEKPFKIQTLDGQDEGLKLFTKEELDRLLEKPSRKPTAAAFTEWRTYAITNWIYATGNRVGTVIEVRIEDVDFTNREIHLRHTKNKKAQIIPLAASLDTVLKEYIRHFRNGVKKGWLFPNVGDEQLTTSALRQAFSDYCKARNVSHANPHGLRHSFARAWIRNGGDTFRLQKILGHSSLEMTRKYVKLFSEDLKEDFDTFNPLDTHKKAANRRKNINVD